MKNVTKWMIVVLLLFQLFGLSAMTALAAPGATDPYDPALSAEEIQAQLGLAGSDIQTLTHSEMSRLIQLCHAIGAYLVRQYDGTLSLELQDPWRVGADHSFLHDYRTGLEEINALIRMGWLTVDDQLNLHPGWAMPTDDSAIEQGLEEIEEQVAGEDAVALSGGAGTAWYGRGLIFSFHSRRHHIPYRYASFGPTFASYFRLGRFGARFSLLFGLHRNFLHQTFRYGGYGYVPYSALYNHYGYNLFYYYPYYYGYGWWYYRYLWY